MPTQNPIACVALAVVLLAAPAAHAHAVHVDWQIADAKLVVVVYFDDELPAEDAEITLKTADGAVVASGKADETGTWKSSVPPPATYRLTAYVSRSHIRAVDIAITPADIGTWQSYLAANIWLVAAVSIAVILVISFAIKSARTRHPNARLKTSPSPDATSVDRP